MKKNNLAGSVTAAILAMLAILLVLNPFGVRDALLTSIGHLAQAAFNYAAVPIIMIVGICIMLSSLFRK